MNLNNEVTRRLQLRHPIIQAPMAGGSDTPELVAAVCDAGGIGFFGAAYLTPQQIEDYARAVRARTQRPFGINLFAPLPAPRADTEAALRWLQPWYAELGQAAPASISPPATGFADQLEAALACGASAFSFTFGLPPRSAIDAIRKRGLFLLGTATTVAEGLALQEYGVDAVVAQGSEAGGHRGSFLPADEADAGSDNYARRFLRENPALLFEANMIGTMALVPQLVDALRIPVIASGGIMDGRGVAAALALGASAVQMGTAFLTCAEAGIGEAYQQALLAARDNETRTTHVFSGRPARGIINRFMVEAERADAAAVLPFPWQNAATRALRSAAAAQGRTEYLSLWAGQGAPLARRQGAAELVARIAGEVDAAIARLSQ